MYLSAIWFAISLLVTLAKGSALRRTHPALSIAWLLGVILVGDFWALLTFGEASEVAALSLFALLAGSFWVFVWRDWNALGQVTWSMTLLTTALFLVYAFTVTAFSPLNPLSLTIAFAFFFLEAITLSLGLTHFFESLDVICRVRWRRQAMGLEAIPGYAPMVSLHVPAHNEPVQMVRQTLTALAQLDYPNYEVLLVDNNTAAEEAWRPLEQICRELGPRFHCLHLAEWPGYKSGALNFALTQTDPRAEIIAIIDADYVVEPDFLSELTPAFADPQMAFVQTPQDYRDFHAGLFSEATYYGYKYFFEVSMPSRNERNAIIFGGTMGLIRKSVLQEIGGWDEWCITEDAEASLRILMLGYHSLYVSRSFGRGLMPLNFEGLKKQRFRWCFGGIQILRKHWEALMPWAHWVDPSNKLTLAQRYYYLAGGLSWYTDLFNLLFAFFLILGAGFSLTDSDLQVRPLTATILIVPAIFLFLHSLRFHWVLRNRLQISSRLAMATMYNFFSLGWVVTLACIQGMIQKEGVFLRTPKSTTESRVWQALRVTQWEALIGLACVTAGTLAFGAHPNLRTFGLSILLCWQGSLYLAAPAYSLLGTRREAATMATEPERGQPVPEQWAARWAIGLSLALVLAAVLFRFVPTPLGVPAYSRFLPRNISLAGIIGAPTSIPAVHIATVALGRVNCRAGPGTIYSRITHFIRGQELEIVARNPDYNNLWWRVKIPDSEETCWVSSSTVRTVGPYDDIRVVESFPPGPATTPTQKVKKNRD